MFTILDAMQIITVAETLNILKDASIEMSGLRLSNESERSRGLPASFLVREINRPSGRVDKEYFSPTGQKFRSLVGVVRSLDAP